MEEEKTAGQTVPKVTKKKVKPFIVLTFLLIAVPTILYLGFRSKTVQTVAVRWMAEQISQTFNTKIVVGGVDISFFNQLVLEKILIEDQANDTLLYVDQLKLQIDSFKLSDQKIHFKSIVLNKGKLFLFQDKKGTNFKFILDSLASGPSQDNGKSWVFTFRNLYLQDTELKFRNPVADTLASQGINFNDLVLKKINLSLVHVKKEQSAIILTLDHASFTEKSGFALQNLAFQARLDTAGLFLDRMIFMTKNSKIVSDSMKITPRTLKTSVGGPGQKPAKSLPIAFQYVFSGNLAESLLSLEDLAYFTPEIWGMNEKVHLSGSLKGSIDNLKFKKLNLRIGAKTNFNADLDLKGLPDWENTYIFFKFYDNTFNFNDLATIKLPDAAENRYPKIPDSMLDDVNLTYQGTFSGFPSDFVAYGKLDGDLGSLSTDIAISPSLSGSLKFQGKLDATSFNAGKFLGYQPLGKVTLHTEVVVDKQDKRFNATIKGSIDSLYYNNNRIDSIYLNGTASNKSYDGQLSVNDKKIKLKFSGKADLESKVPVFNFYSNVKTANLYVLGLDPNHPDAKTSFEMEANFTGKNIDELDGSIDIKKLNLSRGDKSFDVKSLNLKTTNTLGNNNLTLRSDIADFDITGNYRFLEIGLTIKNYLQHYLPSANLPFKQEIASGENVFRFDVKVRKPEVISYFFLPDLTPKSPIYLKGDINSQNKTLNFDCTAENLSYKDYHTQGLTFSSRNSGDHWMLRLGVNEASLGKNYTIENLSLNNTLYNDTLNTTLAWGNTGKLTYSGKIDMEGLFSKSTEGLKMADFTILPSKIWVADTLWQFDRSKLHFDSTRTEVSNFNIHHLNEFFRINGRLTNNPTDKIKIELSKINLGFFDLISKQDIGIEGELNGETEIADFDDSFFLNGNLMINNFRYENNPYGDLVLDNIWNKEEKRLYTSIKLLKEKRNPLFIKGFYTPSNDSINFDAQLTNFPVETIYPFLKDFSNGISGIGNGKVKVTGTFADPNFVGKVDIKEGKIGVDYTKVAYTFNQPVEFSDDSILFRKIILSDSQKNTAVFDGYITHKMFGKLRYNMGLTTKRIQALKTTLANNSMFYGDAHCSGSVAITGAGDQVRLDLNLKTEEGTQLVVPLETPASATEKDFIRFINPDTLFRKKAIVENVSSGGGFEMNMFVNATPDAKIQILFNSTLGDVISGQGSGNLRLVYDKLGNFTMFGDYTIDKGDYLFTLQNVIGKRFKLEEGGTITWNGDPYGAIVDLNAIYKLKASVTDLLLDSYKGDISSRIPVECKINLSRKLLNPNLKFDILFPTADERTRDELLQYISTQDDINRQMLALLLVGQFYTPEYIRGRTDNQANTGALVGATTSQMLSNQLSNWLSQISNSFDVGFNYRPGDQVNTNQMELALSTQIFDDRVTINGNIGNNSSLQTARTNSVVGEIEVLVKLIKSGRLQLKTYNRANNDLIYDTAPYKQGVGLSYRESFDTLYELFHPKRNKKIKNKTNDINRESKD